MEEFLKRFQKLGFGAGASPPPAPPPLDSQDLEKLIQAAVRAALAERQASSSREGSLKPGEGGKTDDGD
jgi:hypothetical protein